MTDANPSFDPRLLLVPPGRRQGAPGTAPEAATSEAAEETPHEAAVPRSPSALHYVVRASLVVVAVLCLGLVAQLAFISSLEHRSSQISLYNSFRSQLALGTAPLGPTSDGKTPLHLGAPVALIRIPALHLQQVVVEGTTSSALTLGPGHQRSTVLPGGVGTSVILGRAQAYGGPFAHIGDLVRGDRITVVTGVGTSEFVVTRVRLAGEVVALPRAGTATLSLGTAYGSAFVPANVLWVDATLVGTPQAATAPLLASVPAAERPLAIEFGTLWALLLWTLAAVAAVAAAVWTWMRRGHVQAWIIFFAPLTLIWLGMTGQMVKLLPNLI